MLINTRLSAGLGSVARSESMWPCVLSWLDVEANSVVGRGSVWNEGSWSLHFIIFPFSHFSSCTLLSVCGKLMMRACGQRRSGQGGEGAGHTMKDMETVLWQLPAGPAIPWLC